MRKMVNFSQRCGPFLIAGGGGRGLSKKEKKERERK